LGSGGKGQTEQESQPDIALTTPAGVSELLDQEKSGAHQAENKSDKKGTPKNKLRIKITAETAKLKHRHHLQLNHRRRSQSERK